VASQKKDIRVYDFITGKLAYSIAPPVVEGAPKCSVTDMCYGPNGDSTLIALYGTVVSIFDLEQQGASMLTFKFNMGAYRICYCHQTNVISVLNAGANAIWQFDGSTGEEVHRIWGHSSTVRDMCVSPRSEVVLL
jgi:WD40 repeat protein